MKQRELDRIERRIETIPENDPNQLRFDIVDGELVLSGEEGEALVSERFGHVAHGQGGPGVALDQRSAEAEAPTCLIKNHWRGGST